jgi:hypothetical protein
VGVSRAAVDVTIVRLVSKDIDLAEVGPAGEDGVGISRNPSHARGFV